MKGIWHDVPKWNASAQRDGVRRRMFVSSMADIFEAHPQVAPWRAEALSLIEKCTTLDVQLLTKRPENVRAMVPPSWLASWPSHVWIGTTVEDQKRAEQRIPHLLNIPARVRFLSCEPLLEAVDLSPYLVDDLYRMGRAPVAKEIQWVIVGGESGHGARAFDLAWARAIALQCSDAGVACFVKQMGDSPLDYGARVRFTAHHGADPAEWPAELRVQEFPQVSP
jgi:protein gp37